MIGVRVLVAFACGIDLVLMALLFREVGRYFIPRAQMWTLMGATMLVTATIGFANIEHVHQKATWYTWAIAIGVIVKAASMALLVHWYGTSPGQQHTATMLSSRDTKHHPQTPLERRVDTLLIAVAAVGTLVLFTLLVVGVTVSRTRQDEAQTHTALCTFTADLHQRIEAEKVAQSRNMAIAKAIRGPIFGVPHATVATALKLQEGVIHGQERTYMSLKGLGC